MSEDSVYHRIVALLQQHDLEQIARFGIVRIRINARRRYLSLFILKNQGLFHIVTPFPSRG